MDRETLGALVRHIWIQWATEQPNPKPSWLVPWKDLPEPDKEVDRRIGEGVRDYAVRELEARIQKACLILTNFMTTPKRPAATVHTNDETREVRIHIPGYTITITPEDELGEPEPPPTDPMQRKPEVDWEWNDSQTPEPTED